MTFQEEVEKETEEFERYVETLKPKETNNEIINEVCPCDECV